MNRRLVSAVLFLAALAAADMAAAQMMRFPAFAGGIPGAAQFQAIQNQRHQARTLLYREALEELRKNPGGGRRSGMPGRTRFAGWRPMPGARRAGRRRIRRPQPRRRLAVLVGNNAYAAPIPSLETPIADVSQIAGLLQSRFGFETRIVKDAGKTKIIEALNRVAAEAKPDDSVLLFYAGHGYLLDDVNMGYWIPVDASVKTAQGWISNSDISRLLAAIPARQLILVSDSCYSGSLTKEQ
jgi:uncharacterized caspase-like protein